MGSNQRHDSLEAIAGERDRAGKMVRYYEHQEKILDKQMKELTRKERTSRLCRRAGMLESFLRSPELLSDDQVMELLRLAFAQEPVRDALERMLSELELESP